MAPMDTLTPKERSARMSRIRARDTKPELLVRGLTHRMGYRYRLHRRDLPGSPDLVFSALRKVIFVHGCFWHRHPNCKLARLPKSRQSFWVPKLTANRARDLVNQARLSDSGWDSLVVWECETRDQETLADRIRTFLGTRPNGRHSVEVG